MGALCGKEAQDSDPFSHPGRTVGSAPATQSRASVPKTTDQGQTLGSTKGGNSLGNDPRSAAAKAAEERAAKSNQPKGKLGRDLASQKAQTRTATLESASRTQRREREIAQAAEARNYA